MNDKKIKWTLSILAGLAWLASDVCTASAAIRLDGSECQGSSGPVTTSVLKSASAAQPMFVVYTLAQPLTADATIPGLKGDKSGQSSSAAIPAKIGVGFGYNYLYTSFCQCPCHGDAQCDGVGPDVLDVVATVGVAFRGQPAATGGGLCHTENSDVNCSGFTDVLDVVLVVNVAFRGANIATEFCDPCAPGAK